MKGWGTTITAVVVLMLSAFGSGVSAQPGHHHATPASSPMAGAEVSTSTGAVYLVIVSNGDEADRLLHIETDAAAAVEVHRVMMRDNLMQMNPVHDGLEISAGEKVSLEPGGDHIMLIGLTESLVAGEEYELTLIFENAGEVTVIVPILRTEPEDGEGTGGPVEVGDLVIQSIWSRHAPKLDGTTGTPVASPEASPR